MMRLLKTGHRQLSTITRALHDPVLPRLPERISRLLNAPTPFIGASEIRL